MKKHVLLSALVALITILAVALAACDVSKTGLELLQQQYGEIASAKTIVQTITIKSGDITQFESEKTYAKTDGGYTITGTEKKLNDTDADELFTVTDINETKQSAASAAPSVKLDESYFETGYRLTDAGLTAKIKTANIKDALGISGELKAPTNDLMLEISVSGAHISTVRISYVSDGSSVTISLAMSY